jgi:hypothetical protein
MLFLFNDIHQCWQRFKIGLSIFVVGAVSLFAIGHFSAFFHYASLTILFVGFGYAMLGYIGIFIQRFSFLKSKKPPPKF